MARLATAVANHMYNLLSSVWGVYVFNTCVHVSLGRGII